VPLLSHSPLVLAPVAVGANSSAPPQDLMQGGTMADMSSADWLFVHQSKIRDLKEEEWLAVWRRGVAQQLCSFLHSGEAIRPGISAPPLFMAWPFIALAPTDSHEALSHYMLSYWAVLHLMGEGPPICCLSPRPPLPLFC